MEACVLNSLAGSFCDIFFFTQTKAPPASSPRSATGISPCGCIAHTYDTIQVSLLDRLDDVSFVTSTVTIITFVFVTVNSSLTPSVISVITFAFTKSWTSLQSSIWLTYYFTNKDHIFSSDKKNSSGNVSILFSNVNSFNCVLKQKIGWNKNSQWLFWPPYC